MQKKIHVGIASGVKIYEEGVTERLRREPGIVVSSLKIATDRECLPTIRTLDILIVDDGVPGLNDLIHYSREHLPALKHIVLILFDNVDGIVHCVAQQVDGIISKHASLNDLVDCIQRVAQNKQQYDAEAVLLLHRKIAADDADSHKAHQILSLTWRQKSVLDLIERGYSNKKIAQALGIEVPTVKNHVHAILEKLNVKSRAEAAACVRPRSLSL